MTGLVGFSLLLRLQEDLLSLPLAAAAAEGVGRLLPWQAWTVMFQTLSFTLVLELKPQGLRHVELVVWRGLRLADRSGKGSSSSRGGRREAIVVASLGCEAPDQVYHDTELYIGV